MTISKSTKLIKGMVVTHDRYSNRVFTIIKAARVWATVRPKPYLPGIDDDEKVKISYIRENCSLGTASKKRKK